VITRRTQEKNIFGAENIRNCEKYVFSIQRRLDKAVATNNVKRIQHIFDLLTKRSQAVKILVVHRVSTLNQGKNTAGVDGIALPKDDKPNADAMKLRLLKEIDINAKPDNIRRVYIPKANGKKRPLGIPTIKDRINQEILRIAVEPIAEYHFHHNSFGFRPKRSCHDAIGLLYIKLAGKFKPKYIVEGDIKGCFDNISHDHIVNTLQSWKIPNFATSLLKGFLKAKVFHNGEVSDNETGTPQGGIISPLLANVALTSLDNHIDKNHSWGPKSGKVIPLVRYADDFVIVCKSKTTAVKIKQSIKEHLSKIGLTLSENKTKITHINDGFDFLGFNIRKYRKTHQKSNEPSDYKLLIKPQRENVVKVLKGCKDVFDKNKASKQDSLILQLNPKLQGWANYYRYVVSSATFGEIDKINWNRTLNWAKRKHPDKSASWIMQKYYTRSGKIRTLNFMDNLNNIRLVHISDIFSKKRFVKVKKKMRVYSAENADYWRNREYHNTFNRLFVRKLRVLFSKQQGICPYCKSQIIEEEVVNGEVHAHHMLPRSFGGTDRYSNLRLLHKECHIELHKRLSRKKMSDIVKSEMIDYIKNLKDYISDDSESRVR
jgi:RNA-directed DNA polymerase